MTDDDDDEAAIKKKTLRLFALLQQRGIICQCLPGVLCFVDQCVAFMSEFVLRVCASILYNRDTPHDHQGQQPVSSFFFLMVRHFIEVDRIVCGIFYIIHSRPLQSDTEFLSNLKQKSFFLSIFTSLRFVTNEQVFGFAIFSSQVGKLFCYVPFGFSECLYVWNIIF